MDYTRRALLAGIACCAVLATPAWARGSRDATEHAPSKAPQLGTGFAVDAQGRLWSARVEAVAEQDAGSADCNIVLAWSADDGKTWTATGTVLSVPEPVEANGEGRPKLAFGPAGQLYLTFTRPLGKPHTGHIRFVRSTDGGRTFSAPVTVQHDLSVSGHRFDSLIVDREGRIFIAWIDKRDGDIARAAKRQYQGAAIYYTVSIDGGATFATDARLADNACECCRISLALNSKGQVVAMWRHIFAPNIRDHASAILSTAGLPGAMSRVSFDDWRIDACPHHGPSHAFDGDGRRHQVWFSGAEEGGGLFYSAPSPDGRAGQPVRLGGAQASHGDVIAAGRRIVIVWKEFDGQMTQVNARLSDNGGKTWRERALAATRGASDHPHLLLSGAGILLAWCTGDDNVIVRKIEAQS